MSDPSEEDDYMSMTIPEPTTHPLKETPIQRRVRKQREAEDRSRTKSKAELKMIEDAAREDALSKSLFDKNADTSTDPRSKNKAFNMMQKMGFKPGTALGLNNEGARLEPIGIAMKDDRGGIGLDAEKKRKIREEYEGESKRIKVEEDEYRERVRREREEARREGQIGAAQRIAERMEGEKREEREILGKQAMGDGDTLKRRDLRTLKSVNVLWRGLVRRREEKEREKRMRYDLHQSLSSFPTYGDSNEDADDRRALGKEKPQQSLVEDIEEEDRELDEFNALEPVEKLVKLVEYLRVEHKYCFWCKHTYPDEEMEGCPGKTEEDHD